MFSGWGIRTLSADHPAYNPFAYHRGTVWPVMNAMFTLGFASYGFHVEAQALCKAIFESASLFEHNRLPEVFAGHQRDPEHPFPGMYVKTHWPQAWSASAPFAMIQAMLGILPYAPLGILFLDPALPPWLPALRVEGLRVGQARLTLAFRRGSDGSTGSEVLDQEGSLHVVRHSAPWSLLVGSGQQVEDTVKDILPV
jgi:glycogen debranching enzyme